MSLVKPLLCSLIPWQTGVGSECVHGHQKLKVTQHFESDLKSPNQKNAKHCDERPALTDITSREEGCQLSN